MAGLEDRVEAAFARWAGLLVDHRVAVLALVAALTAVFAWGTSQAKINTANEYFFLPNDEFLVRYDDFKRTFGTDEFVYVLLDTEEVFEPEFLGVLGRLSAAALTDIPHVTEVHSILDVESIEAADDGIVVAPFMGEDGPPSDPAALAALRARALAHPIWSSLFVSPDARHAGLLIETAVIEGDGEFRKKITDAARALVDRPEYARYRPKVVGPPIMDADVDRTLARESRIFGLASLALISLVLLLTFRRPIDVLTPLIVVAVTDLWVIGSMGFAGVPLTMMSIVLPGVITVVGVGDAIHVIAEYRARITAGADPRAAVVDTVRRTGLPCAFTSLTTMVGFGSLMAMDLRPGREMGLFAAIGVVVAFVQTFVILPPLLSLSSTRNLERSREGVVDRVFRRLLAATAELPIRHRWPVLAISAALSVAAGFGLARVEVSADFLRVFGTSTRIRQDYEAVDTTLGGTATLEIVVSAEAPGAVFEPDFLRELEALDTWLRGHDHVLGTSSVLDVLKELNLVANDGDPAARALPEDRATAAQLFLLYESGGAEGIDRLITPERDRVRLTVRSASLTSKQCEAFLDGLAEWTTAHLRHARAVGTGQVPLFVRMVHSLTRSQIASFGLAFVAVSVMMVLLFRSFGLGMLAMVPNVLPVAVTLGFMGFAGITLNVGTVMIASIAIGIAVDDSIHFVSHFRRHRAAGDDVEHALRQTTVGVGQALLTTSVVLALGFSVFGLSTISHLVNFGLLTALTVTTALACDFFLLPTLLWLRARARST